MAFISKFRPVLFSAGVVVMTLGATFSPTAAQEVKIATSYKLMTLDPQYADLNENTSLLSHIFERLIYQDETMQARPGLAASWKRLSPTQWEFKLRENARFHDGSPFTAQDVIYSIDRVQHFLKPPGGGFEAYVQAIKSVTASDPLTVIIETNGDVPTLPLSLSSIFIMHRQDKGFETTDELNAGSSVVGTGPYKFASWQSGEVLKLIRNDDYWAGKPTWSAVTFRVVESPAARVAALTTGDVDIADYIPARDVATLKSRGIKIDSTSAARSNFLQFDVSRETLPGVTDKSGKPIPNPFRDARVRHALAMATDRPFLAEKILQGYGTAASQLFPTGMPGTSSKLSVIKPDYETAKALLAKAGYPDGFNVVLGGPAGRYPGDSEALQSVAQNWARIGVKAQPTVAPYSVYANKLDHGDYAAWYAGCSGNAVTVCLDAVLATKNDERKTGSLNYGGYSNPAFDDMLTKAETIDVGPERDAAVARATDFIMPDDPIIPLYHFHLIVGHGQRVASYTVHPRGWTTAMQAVPAGE
ncbi:ABC transporter substrate-binding protein [Rhizobium lusitanum]|uniref:ABC transporter substrate-binding protein n=1 Tax=Rhizobium lusitanum TaxID=293958 RepID=A0A6L9UF59_9HYPH|nr:ABC transporter substrate-binding protein [Rhizobium lusitanum]NEI73979.1 ABC transporter substrate-binding protein [Rhizobium lusitanum]